MARGGFDISVFGVRELEKKFKTVAKQTQGKILRPVIRASVKRGKARMVANLSGDPVAVRSTVTLRAFRGAPVRAAKAGRGNIKIGVKLPLREDLDIPENAQHYYPMAIEYGHGKVAARPFMRPAIDDHREQELRLMKTQIELKIRAALRK